METAASMFGKDFTWGTATSAFQCEGSMEVGEKIPSIWDTFTRKWRRVKDGSNAKISSDFYNRYPEDLGLAKQIGAGAFRFSLAWTRIINKDGTVNLKGIDHYQRVADYCLKSGLEPWVTLYHWDLPQHLEDMGGWANRNIVGHFSKYAEVCGRYLGDRVKHWMILNEPAGFTSLGYMIGLHAPGRRGINSFMGAVHHAAMCQAEGGRIIRREVPEATIGTCFSCSPVDPFRDTAKDQAAAERVDALLNRLFIEPALGMGYPSARLPLLNRLEKHIFPDDMKSLAFDFDFIGLQNYFRIVCKYNPLIPLIQASEIPATKRNVPLSELKLEIYPEGMYRMLKQFDGYSGVRKIIVTENGVSVPDKIENGAVNDHKRISYLNEYLRCVLKAKNEGVKADGYFIWSLTDNFEWAEGLRPRFGLIHVDFNTQKRTIKDSGYWFRDFLMR